MDESEKKMGMIATVLQNLIKEH